MNPRFFARCSFLAAVIASASLAQAGVLSFTPLANDAAAVNISTSHTYTHTISYNTNSAAIINGVTFTPGTHNGVNYTLTGPGNGFNNNTQAEIASGGTGLNALGNDFYYGGPTQVFTITGLTPGHNYRTGLVVFGWNGADQNMTVSDAPGVTHTFDRDGDNVNNSAIPVAIEYLFTAPASGEIVYTITAVSPNDTLHNYGFYNQFVSVPEPATLGFLALAAGALTRRRRGV